MSDSPFNKHNHSVLSNVRNDLLVCNICHCTKSVKIIKPIFPTFPWLTSLECTKDKTHQSWSVCRFCSKSRVQYKTMTQIKRHHRIYHKSKYKMNNCNIHLCNKEKLHSLTKGKITDEDILLGNNSESPSMDNVNTFDEVDEGRKLPANINNTNTNVNMDFSNNACNDYFWNQYKNDNGDSYLVSKSCFNGEAPPSSIDDDEKQLILLITKMSMILSRDDRILFTLILSLLEDLVKKRCLYEKKGFHNPWKVKIPKDPVSLRSLTINCTNSIIPSLPIPSIEVIGDHTYLSIIHIISDLLANGHKIAKIKTCNNENTTSLCSSPFISKVNDRGNLLHIGFPVLNLFIIEWSDAFEPNKMKNNRNSIWIKTVTISPVNGLSKNSHHNTYPLALGPKNSSHEMIEERFKEDLQILQNGSPQMFYNGHTKSMFRVHAELVLSIQDQPERRGENHIALGMSNYTARFGYLLNVNYVKDLIIPCKLCEQILFSNRNNKCIAMELDSCQTCASWDYLSKKELLSFNVPNKYPAIYNLNSNNKLIPKKQTFEQLLTATAIVHNNRVNRNWNKEQSRTFMQSEGINTKTQNEILYNAANCTVEQNLDESDIELGNILEREKNYNPTSFSKWTCSAWTRGVEVWQHVEAVMHLVFHGIQKTNMILIETWASRCSSLSALQRFGIPILQKIQVLNLDWCKLVPYNGGRFGGWMAENYLAMARINCWFYSMLHTLPKDKAYAGDPEKCQTKWTKKENINWLQARGLPVNQKDSASTISCNVATLIVSDNTPPILTPSSFTADNVEHLVEYSTKMINLIMNRVVNDEYLLELDISIKMFLTLFHKFDKSLQLTEKEKPTWITSYNYLCLLNLPNIARNFGPLRNIWEGGYIGEGFLRLVKPHITRGLRKNWQKNIHIGILQRKCFNHLCDNYLPQKNITQKKYCLYPNINDITYHLISNNILCCIHDSEGKFFFVLKDKSLVQLEIGMFHSESSTLYYFEMRIMDEPNYYQLNNIKIESYCLLLPKLNNNGLPDELNGEIDTSVYTIVNSEWKQISRGKTIE